jgi:CotH kinase protein/Lamin Tail Domain/Chitobiase/beta-hexosaminidase C-terminal domain/Fn3 associated/Bacterial TSP3 repeat
MVDLNDKCDPGRAWPGWLRGGFVFGSLALAGSCFVETLASAAPPAVVRLNEILASNVSPGGLVDEDGQQADWIEIVNGSGAPVNLAGWSLTDEPDNPDKWLFPAITIDPGQFQVIFASGKDRRSTAGNLHANFKLKHSGEYLGLFNLALGPAAVSAIAPNYPDQRPDYSYGLDASGNWVYFQSPTPGAVNNGASIVEIVQDVAFNVSGGVFNVPFCLVLSTPTPGSTIRYTLDGSEPTAGTGLVYGTPPIMSATRFVRASAFKAGALPARTKSRTYLFTSDAGVLSLPIMSLGIRPYDWLGSAGIVGIHGGAYDQVDCCFSSWRRTTASDFFNPAETGLAWERGGSLEMLPWRNERGFNDSCGIRVHGSESSRLTYHPESKFSYSLFFRGDYGAGQLDYPLMPQSSVKSFDGLVLRAGHNDIAEFGGSFVTDELMRRLFSDMGQASSHGTFINLFINGTGKGYYNLVERINDKWARLWYGGANDWDVIDPYSEAVDGDNLAWFAMLDYVLTHDQSVNSYYQEMELRLDMVNFADYLLLNIYADTRDWTQNNWRAIRERVSGGKFRFTVWDAEFAMGLGGDPVTSNNMTNPQELGKTGTDFYNDPVQIALLYRRLKASPEFRLIFADRVQKHFLNNGALTMARISNRFEELRQTLAAVIPAMPTYIADQWVPRREANMMQQLANAALLSTVAAPSFNQHGGSVAAGFGLTMSAAAGQIYYTLDGEDPRVPFSGNNSPSARSYTGGIVLSQSTVVKARAKNGVTWSALTEAEFGIAALGIPLRITEIMYNPSGGDTYEFIEIQNVGSTRVDLGGMSVDGIGFVFPIGSTIDPGSTIVLGSSLNPSAFAARYPGVVVYATFDGTLSNGGERLALEDRNGQTITSVSYDDKDGWPVSPDGSGYSLEFIDLTRDPNDPANWRASSNPGGSPGNVMVGNPPPMVRINEIMAENVSAVANGSSYPDWIELYNAGGTAVALAGWSLSDDGNPRRFVFPAGVSIAANGYLVIWCDAVPDEPGLHTGFGLDLDGESIFLYDAATNRIDAVGFGSQIPNHTVGLSVGVWRLNLPTPGSANVAAALGSPASLIVNEWLANPAPGLEDWLELYNRDLSRPVSLTGLFLATSNSLFQITALSFVPAGGHARLWADKKAGPGHVDFKLPTEAGTIVIYDGNGAEIDRVVYGAQQESVSQGLWPDGGASIVLFPAPTPGTSNSLPPYTGPILNELLARNRTGAVDSRGQRAPWIELINPGAAPFHLGGMKLGTGTGKADRWTFPAGVQIPGNGYRVVWFDASRPASTVGEPDLNAGLFLSGNGGAVQLLDSEGHPVDKVEFGFQVRDRSLGRSGGPWRLLSTPSPGTANSAPAALGAPSSLRINEWMAKATMGKDWFELYNTSAQPVELSALLITDDPSILGSSLSPVRPLSFIDALGWVKCIADGDPRKGPNHFNFNLDGDGDVVRVYTTNLVVIDDIYFGLQLPGVSQGRYPDAGFDARSFTVPSPGENNSLDNDNDGMPNSWETAHGLSNGSAADAAQDSDGDGFTNLEEYLSGTDPRDNQSYLAVDSNTAANRMHYIRFRASANRSYSVVYRDSATTGPWLKLVDIDAQLDTTPVVVTDSISISTGDSTRFYRLLTPALP